jgi:hypothetical protein
MYSGSTLTNKSGNLLGAHQKINRTARRALREMLLEDNDFPSKKLLLHFEGKNGPDGMKSKSAGNDPWHFYDPYDPEDTELIKEMNEHFFSLVSELKKNNLERSAFEASWLAHALVDGLTPAHQFPYEQRLNNLHGNTKEQRDTIFKKIVAPGETTIQIINNNWQIWGAKGLMSTHSMFEIGSATIIKPLPSRIAYPSLYDIKNIERIGLEEYFKRTAREVALLDIYDRFYRRGWTPKLTKLVKKEMAPRMACSVTLAWYLASKKAGLTKTIK